MREISYLDVIRTEIHNSNDNSRTCFPAKVVGVNSLSSGSVSVEISNPRFTDDGENMDDVQVLNVPVAPMRSGTSIIYFPVRIGDTGYCIVSDNSLDNFKISSNTLATKVNDNRMKDAQDAIFVPGLAPFAVIAKQHSALSLPRDLSDLMIIHNTGTVQECNVALKADGNVELNSQFTVKVLAKDIEFNASDSVSINASTMNVNVSSTNWTGQGYVTGEWTVNNIPVSTHVHLGVVPGPGVTGLPVA